MNDKELNQIIVKSIWYSLHKIEDTEFLKETGIIIAKKANGGNENVRI
ncbi:hypothetical protein [Massiliimalia timonensis]|nr:hypothetical protein [Massiliimalia timonensis]